MPGRALIAVATLAVVTAAWGAPGAAAAGPPSVDDTWAANVSAGAADLKGAVNPNGLPTLARIQYVSAARYEANVAASLDPFAGGAYSPLSGVSLGAGTEPVSFTRPIAGLEAATAYRYRIVASNSAGPAEGPTMPFATTPRGGASFALPDGRGWEMVSPAQKNGGEVQPPGGVFGGGVFQAAAAGGAIAYSSTASFGAAVGAPGASQYVSRRGAGGWLTANVTRPSYGGGYGPHPDGAPYQLFDPTLGRGLFASPWACGAEPCPRAYGLLDLATGAATASPALADLRAVAASEDLSTVLLSTCAKLTAEATEVPLGGGCDPAAPNLYSWTAAGLRLVNLLPGDATGTPGAAVAASAGAVSSDGSSIYFTLAGDLYLRRGGQTVQVDAAVGGGGSFETASANGAVAYFTKAGHLHRYAAGGVATDLTPAGGVTGVLGASPNGEHVYYLTADGVQHRIGATTTKVAEEADPSDYPPATATARVAADGTLAFLSAQSWPGSDSAGHPQAFVYSPASGRLACVSCNPTGVRSQGAARIAAAMENGTGPSASSGYRPRALSAAGDRLVFESVDPLVLGDTNSARDVYEWEARGVGGCAQAAGCVALLSSGRAEGGARFLDASADGDDVYFLTGRSLVEADPGGDDVYVARVGGGFPVPSAPIPCTGDACQPLPDPPGRPTLATAVLRPEANPPLKVRREWVPKRAKRRRCAKRARSRHAGHRPRAKCAKRHGKHRGRRGGHGKARGKAAPKGKGPGRGARGGR